MLLAVSVDSGGTIALIGGVVTLFGTATMLLIKVGDRSEDRYKGEIDRLRTDKDDTIDALRADLKDARDERDHWLDKYAQAIGHPIRRQPAEDTDS